ncbi:MAG TPA: FAD-dependent oxidoreductase [Alphaproteobacteria bacterium]|nr:FAD-dependent oxidoreductase [Alphaproteobacteria bacterium]
MIKTHFTIFSFALAFLFANSLHAMEEGKYSSLAVKQISLSPLDYSTEAVIGSNVGIRPKRAGGIRLEIKTLDDKAIIHNYGHGGAGVTLAPGCVEKAVSLLNQEEPDKKSVSVIGAGYMGLLTALRLTDEGYTVKVYADQFPQSDYFYQEGKPCITSLVAGGLWYPMGVEHGEDETLFKSLQQDSFNYYKNVIDTSKHPGVSFRKAYSFSAQGDPQFPDELAAPIPVKVEFGNQHYTPAREWSTILIDGNIFLNHLYNSLKEKNVTFEQKKFSTNEDILKLEDTYIFNCTGYGSKYLFDDNALKPIRGQLLYLKPQPSFDYFLFGGDGSFSVFPSSDKITIWGTYEEGVDTLEIEPAELGKMREKVASFFKDKIH